MKITSGWIGDPTTASSPMIDDITGVDPLAEHEHYQQPHKKNHRNIVCNAINSDQHRAKLD